MKIIVVILKSRLNRSAGLNAIQGNGGQNF